MKLFEAKDLACPHCSTKNQLSGIRLPKDFQIHQLIIKCFNAEEQKGCMKDFAVNIHANIFTSLTKDQMIENLKHEQLEKQQEGANPN